METIQALDFIQSNYSFASAADDSEKFWIMFPDSEIAKSYNQGEQLILDDIKRKPFSLLFDETTAQ